jgi:enoyl-CoA hydratase
MSGRILIERDGPLAFLVFDQPERLNALSSAMWRAIPPACAELAQDPCVRAVILRGAGEAAFVAGADISEFEQSRTPENRERYDAENAAAYAAIAALPMPTIAMVHGFCIGGGLAIALQADLRYVADDARLGIPAARLGLGYGFEGLAQLTHLVGPSFAKELLFTAKRFRADEARAMGLVNAVFPKAELEREVRSLARTIADNAPLTVASAKRCVDQALRDPADRDAAAIADGIRRCYESADYREGVRAFLEKRAPGFRGE